jgi:nicotinate-nucleotide adenylyltransferase
MAAKNALTHLGLERVIFIPAASPPHKRIAELAGSRHRFNMVRLAVRGNCRLSVSAAEMRRTGPSYTYDTARQIGAKFPGRPLIFIVGADTVPEIPTWSRYRKLLKLVRFAVAPRHGHRLATLAGYRDRFLLLRSPRIRISSSAIRAQIRLGRHVPSRHLPRQVADYIRRAGLYRPSRESRPRERMN